VLVPLLESILAQAKDISEDLDKELVMLIHWRRLQNINRSILTSPILSLLVYNWMIFRTTGIHSRRGRILRGRCLLNVNKKTSYLPPRDPTLGLV